MHAHAVSGPLLCDTGGSNWDAIQTRWESVFCMPADLVAISERMKGIKHKVSCSRLLRHIASCLHPTCAHVFLYVLPKVCTHFLMCYPAAHHTEPCMAPAALHRYWFSLGREAWARARSRHSWPSLWRVRARRSACWTSTSVAHQSPRCWAWRDRCSASIGPVHTAVAITAS